MRLAFLAHPVRGDVEMNLYRARQWVKRLVSTFQDLAVAAPWIIECELFDDGDEVQRRHGILRNKVTISRCDELILAGDVISPGMSEEMKHAQAVGVPVFQARIDETGSVALTRFAG